MAKASSISHGDQPGPQPALDEQALRRAILAPGRLWTRLDVAAVTGSTNTDLLAAARAGAPEGTVLAAERQDDGRGRQGRAWASRPGMSLTFSVLLRPAGVPPSSRGWLPLLAGVALARAVRDLTGIQTRLKWPNDLLTLDLDGGSGGGAAGGSKVAGILAEQAGDAIVVGFGINVGGVPPGSGAAGSLAPASLAAAVAARGGQAAGDAGRVPDRGELLAAVLTEMQSWYRAWTAQPRPGDPDGCGLRAEYLHWSATVGRDLRVELPGGAVLAGRGSGIDAVGRLVVDAGGTATPVSAGDVLHVR
ncbi:MAG TPA: biotin--[acetyl-CoA-carboxylase] ligase [Streptosporangiaceae bacterium]